MALALPIDSGWALFASRVFAVQMFIVGAQDAVDLLHDTTLSSCSTWPVPGH